MKRDYLADLDVCDSVKGHQYTIAVNFDDGVYDKKLGCVKIPTMTKKDEIAEKYVFTAVQALPYYIKRCMELETEIESRHLLNEAYLKELKKKELEIEEIDARVAQMMEAMGMERDR